MGKYDEKVETLFEKHVHPMKLPPKLAGNIKKRMTKAARTNEGDTKAVKAAIGAYLTERGYNPETGKKGKGRTAKKAKRNNAEPAETKTEKSKKAKVVKKDTAAETLEASGGKAALKGDAEQGVPKGNIDLRKLDRRTMKGMAKDLGVSYKKAWTDDELRAELAKKMIGLDSKVQDAIAKADPVKIDALADCVGLLIDLTKVICITCPAQTDCRQQFEAYKADGFKIFDSLQPGTTNVPLETAMPNEVIPASSLSKKAKKKQLETSAFNADRKIDVYDFDKVKELPKVKVDGAEVESNMEHKEFLRDVKKEVPETLGEFRDLLLKHYDVTDDDKEGHNLTMWFARYCEALEVIKLI